MVLRGLFRMVGRVQMMTLRDMGMVAGLLVPTGLVVFRCMAVMPCRVLVVLSRLPMVLGTLMRSHRTLP